MLGEAGQASGYLRMIKLNHLLMYIILSVLLM